MATFNIGTKFSHDPSGRYYTDGNSSGEYFRENFLLPAIKNLEDNEKLTLILDDDVDTYGSSFLNESFGGMVRFGYIESQIFLDLINFNYTDKDYEFYEKRIISYIKEADYNSKTYTPTEQR